MHGFIYIVYTFILEYFTHMQTCLYVHKHAYTCNRQDDVHFVTITGHYKHLA